MDHFCEAMTIEGMTEKTYTKIVSSISKEAENFSQSMMDNAVALVRKAHYVDSSDEVLDFSVSFDGSWHKRGHTSKHGIAAVIEVTTGLVVDFYVMSSYCQVSIIYYFMNN